jgi:hypothetical protein
MLVAESGIVATRHDGSEKSCLRGQRAVTDRIHADVHAMQPAGCASVTQCTPAQSEVPQLAECHQAVLPGGELSDPKVDVHGWLLCR